MATTGFTDYFPADGELTVLTTDAIGAEDILALKQTLMPVEGYKVWNVGSFSLNLFHSLNDSVLSRPSFKGIMSMDHTV